jgi:hypothetical protein
METSFDPVVIAKAKEIFMAEFSDGHGKEFMEKMWQMTLDGQHFMGGPPCYIPMTCDACVRDEYFEKARTALTPNHHG